MVLDEIEEEKGSDPEEQESVDVPEEVDKFLT